MTLLSYPFAIMLLCLALLGVIAAVLAPPRQVRGLLLTCGAVTVAALVIDLVVALR